MDEALSLPTEEAARVAIRTQQIIAHESGVPNTIDPLGGSYFIETLCMEMEEKMMDYIKRIDGMGGAVKAIEKGFFQRELSDSAYKFQKALESRDRIVVGVNEYLVDEEIEMKLFEWDPEMERKQIESLNKLRKERDSGKANKYLELFSKAVKSGNNLVYPAYEASKAYVTIGEMCNVLRETFGEYREKYG